MNFGKICGKMTLSLKVTILTRGQLDPWYIIFTPLLMNSRAMD